MTRVFWTFLLIGLTPHGQSIATEPAPLTRECATRVFELAGQDFYVNGLNRRLQHLNTRNGARGPSVLAAWNEANAQGRTGVQTQQFIDSNFFAKRDDARDFEVQLCGENVLYQRAHNSVTHFPLAECQRRLRACALALSRPSRESTPVTCRDAQVRIPNQTVWNNYLDSLYKSEMLREMHEDSDAARTGVLANGQNCARDWVPENRGNLADPGSATGTAAHEIDPCTGTTVCATCTLDENASGGGFSQLRDFARSLGHDDPSPRDWSIYWSIGNYYKEQLKTAYVKALAASVYTDCEDWRTHRTQKSRQVGRLEFSELQDNSRRSEAGTDAAPSTSPGARACTINLFNGSSSAESAVNSYMARSCRRSGGGASEADGGTCPRDVQRQLTPQLQAALQATRQAAGLVGRDPFLHRRTLIGRAASKAARVQNRIHNIVNRFKENFANPSGLIIDWEVLKGCRREAVSCLLQNCSVNVGRGSGQCRTEQIQSVLALVESVVTLNQLYEQLTQVDRALSTTVTQEVRVLGEDRQVGVLDAIVAQRSQAGCNRDEGSQSCTEATASAISDAIHNQRRQIAQGLQGMCGIQDGTRGGFNRLGRLIVTGNDRASQELFFRWARTSGRGTSRLDLCRAVRGARHDDSEATLGVFATTLVAALATGAAVPLMGGGAMTAAALSMGVDLGSFLADTMPRLEESGSFANMTLGAQQACVASATAVLQAQENYKMAQLMSVAELLIGGGFAGLEARAVVRSLGAVTELDSIVARADRLSALEGTVAGLRAAPPAGAVAREATEATTQESVERVARDAAQESGERATRGTVAREGASEGGARSAREAAAGTTSETSRGTARRGAASASEAASGGELTARSMPRSMPTAARNNPEIRAQWGEAAAALGCTNPARCPALEETYQAASRAPSREVREALNLGRESLTQQETVMLAEIRAHLARQAREAAQAEGRQLTEREVRRAVDSQLAQRISRTSDELATAGVCATGAAGAR